MTTSLSEARERVMQERWSSKGTICPCCDGIANVYNRPMNVTMAKILVQLFLWDVQKPGEYRHVKNEWPYTFGTYNAEYARMVYMDLIEAPPEGRKDGNPRAGRHRITELGRRFVRGEIRIPERVYCYKGRVLERSDTTISISDAMQYPFDYTEVVRMAAKPGERRI